MGNQCTKFEVLSFSRSRYVLGVGADVKIKNHRLGQYGAEPNYSTLPFWQLCALKGKLDLVR